MQNSTRHHDAKAFWDIAYTSETSASLCFYLYPNRLHEWCYCQMSDGFLLRFLSASSETDTCGRAKKLTKEAEQNELLDTERALFSVCEKERETQRCFWDETFSRKSVQPCAPAAESKRLVASSSPRPPSQYEPLIEGRKNLLSSAIKLLTPID